MTARLLVAVLELWLSGTMAYVGSSNPGLPRGWEPLYVSSDARRPVLTVRLDDQTRWHAGGRGFLIDGDANGVTTTDIGQSATYAIAPDSSGQLVAVGWPLAVWVRLSDKWEQVFASPPRRKSGRRSEAEVLFGLGYLDPVRPGDLIAYGPWNFIVRRNDAGWAQEDNRELGERARFGPEDRLPGGMPKGCRREHWQWSSGASGTLVCRDGRVFSFTGPERTAEKRLPASCRSIWAIARDGGNTFVACGRTETVWRRPAGADRYQQLKELTGVRSLDARAGCLLVGTPRSVLRRCRWDEPQ